MAIWPAHFGDRWREALLRRIAAPEAGSSRQRLGHIVSLMSGNVAASVISLISVAIVARALGAYEYGIFALIISFAQAIERMVSFQSWQPLIRYGAGLTDPEHHDDLKRLLKFGIALDVAGSIVAWLCAVALGSIALQLLDWQWEDVRVGLIYATVLLFGLTGMPTAVLRLAGRFRAVAYGQVVSALIRLAASVGTMMAGGDLADFALVWMITQITGTLTTVAIALLVLRKQGVTGLFRAPLAGIGERFPDIWRFSLGSNITLTLWSSTQQFDTLLVGALAGPQAAGLYHIAKRAGRLGQQVGTQIQAVIYPEITQLWSRGRIGEFRQVVAQAEVVLSGVGAIMVLGTLVVAEPLIRLAAGDDFVDAAPLLVAQMVAVALAINASIARSALLAMGEQKPVLHTVTACTAVFYVIASLLTPLIGAMGANVAHIAMGGVLLGGLMLIYRGAVRAAIARAD